MTPERFSRIHNVLVSRQPDLTVIADGMHKERNLSAVVRTCDAVGVATVHSIIPEGGYQTYRRATKGAHQWVEVIKHQQLSDIAPALKQQGFQIVATVADPQAPHFKTIDYTKPTALLMGGEKFGLHEDSIATADSVVTIPMMGMTGSYNVSVAAAIILSEAQQQRQDKGMYNDIAIDQVTYERLFFRWAHPVLARACDTKNITYPKLRDDGEVADPQELSQLLNQKT